jgi:hypothetical protein
LVHRFFWVGVLPAGGAQKPHTLEHKVPLCRRLNAPTA